MSARYYSSPGLHLKIGKSRIRAVLYAVLCGLVALSLALVWARGFHALATVLLPVAVWLLFCLGKDAAAGVELGWLCGTWSINGGGQWQMIFPAGRTALTPWVICLAYSLCPGGRLYWLWLYTDAVSFEDLRSLRVRLALQP